MAFTTAHTATISAKFLSFAKVVSIYFFTTSPITTIVLITTASFTDTTLTFMESRHPITFVRKAAAASWGYVEAPGDHAGELPHEGAQPADPGGYVLLCEGEAELVAEGRAVVCEHVVAGAGELALEACEDGVYLGAHVGAEPDGDALAEGDADGLAGDYRIDPSAPVVKVSKRPF